jgi:amino acid transporter
VTFLVAFAVMCSGVASTATLATAFGGDYLAEFVTLPRLLVGAVFIGLLALVNFRGIKESVTVNLGLTSVELCGLLLVTAIGLAFLLDDGGDAGRALEFKSGEAVPLAILPGAALAFYALIGWPCRRTRWRRPTGRCSSAAVLVLRSDRVEHAHRRAPTALPCSAWLRASASSRRRRSRTRSSSPTLAGCSYSASCCGRSAAR